MDADRVAQYWKDGFVQGIAVLTPAEVAAYRARFLSLEAAELKRHGGQWTDRDFKPYQDTRHTFRDLFNELARLPRMLDAVEMILGPNLLIRNGDVFVKAPRNPDSVSWHIDSSHRDGTEDGMLTVWLGLGAEASDGVTGGLIFHRGGHKKALSADVLDDWGLGLEPAAQAEIDISDVVQSCLRPGQISLHHIHTPHRSRYNWGDEARIGMVLRFMSPAVSPEMAGAGVAALVRGHDPGAFDVREHFPVFWAPQNPRIHRHNLLVRARRRVRRRWVRWRSNRSA